MTRKTPRAKQQDVITLTDLAPRQRVMGGSGRRVFGSDTGSNPLRSDTMPKSTKKDLPAGKTGKHVKGGRLIGNDNLTLARPAKPTKKDLPAGKDVKAGKKTR
jgi:hypothetical protein